MGYIYESRFDIVMRQHCGRPRLVLPMLDRTFEMLLRDFEGLMGEFLDRGPGDCGTDTHTEPINAGRGEAVVGLLNMGVDHVALGDGEVDEASGISVHVLRTRGSVDVHVG